MTRKQAKIDARTAPRKRRTAAQMLADLERAVQRKRDQIARMEMQEDGVVELMQKAIGSLTSIYKNGPPVSGLDSIISELKGMQSMRISDLNEGSDKWIREVHKRTRK